LQFFFAQSLIKLPNCAFVGHFDLRPLKVYPEVSLLKQVQGVGTQIVLTHVLTIEDPTGF